MSELLKEYEFKGQPLHAFTKGRLTLAAAAGVRVNGGGTVKDILGIIFLCACDNKTRSLAQLDPSLFWEKEEEWETNLDLQEGDYLTAGELVKSILEDVTSTKAEPINNDDLSQLPDPSPNEQSQTI